MRVNTKVNLKPGIYKELPAILASQKLDCALLILDVKVDQLIGSNHLNGKHNKVLFDASASEPTTEDVDRLCAVVADNPKIDSVVAVGGGSTMDLGKAVAIATKNGAKSEALQGWNIPRQPGLPCITVPTISGTGAELSMTAVLKGPKRKLGINSEYTAPSLAVVDPFLTSTVGVADGVPTSMDCYIHSVEIALGHSSNLEAKLLANAIIDRYEDFLLDGFRPADLSWATEASICSYLGGASLSDGSVGACHAISYGLSYAFGIRHGVANLMAFQYLTPVYAGYVKKVTDYCELVGYQIPFLNVEASEREKARDAYLTTSLSMEKLWINVFPGEDWRERAHRTSLDVWGQLVMQ